MLRKRLGLEAWERDTPFREGEPEPDRVRIRRKQHAGVPVTPVVKEGDRVRRGQPLGRTGEGELGAAIHASMDGTVRNITEDAIELWR
jgi:Na+-translocating ferredoxin:NAD+ oxidoreductase RnfC subunit